MASNTRRTQFRLAAALLPLCAAAVLALLPHAADASCASAGVLLDDAVRSAPTVFVGTVTTLSSGGRVATVRVDDVWRGNGIRSSVEVVGTPDLNAAATSVDRIFAMGSQYLFVPDGGGPEHFTDNTCTATRLYSSSLAAVRPADAPGVPVRPTSTFPLAVVLLAAIVVLSALGTALALRRRPTVTGRW